MSVDDMSVHWAESELLGAGEVVQRLNISRGTLDNWRKAKRVIALRKGLRNYVYPLRQFERLKPVEGLDRLATLFSSTEEAWEWLVTPNRTTGGKAPIEKLREGAVDVVISAAEGALDYA
ncbi:MbcA/ParS/Xre antitoxin family protein [Mesorhizobium sp. M0510]|uniref:antitoxin Xre/MbcA/ParS-like domain-containing protein n=1 Tax=Mesorhizobium sp. M0510 TaxID=2956954 RepID=UPI0033364DA9